MSGMATYTPGMEITGGSLGHGLTSRWGCASAQAQRVDELRLQPAVRRRTRRGRYVGSGHVGGALEARQPDRYCRRQQSAGRRPVEGCASSEPVDGKFRAFGWYTQRVDGNDIDALVSAFDAARAHDGAAPRAIICDTLMGKGVRFPGAAREATISSASMRTSGTKRSPRSMGRRTDELQENVRQG